MASKNVKITTDEIKVVGILCTNEGAELKNGAFVIETEGGNIDLGNKISIFNGDDVEISIKRKKEEVL